MPIPKSRGFLLSLVLIFIAAGLLAWSHHFHARMVGLTDSALATLTDELVERHRDALVRGGVPGALRESWFLLRDQFVITTIKARQIGNQQLVYIHIWSNPELPAHPHAHQFFTLTPGEDDTWAITPLRWPLTFWLR
ncbi:MAG: hypothetical protein O3B24_06130 [Verrucomicrobia bacterium]|nr:hypothetical protein [Verrucomicrobiota bacterium]